MTLPPSFQKALILLPLLSLNSYAVNKCEPILSHFLAGEPEVRLSQVVKFHSRGKASIETLLTALEDTGRIEIIMANPRSSTIETFSYCGVVAAYLIELILGRAELRAKLGKGDPFLGWDPKDYPFGVGAIVTERGLPTTKDDLPHIAGTYRAWWRANKDRSLDELRKEWSSGKRPLDGSGFRWR